MATSPKTSPKGSQISKEKTVTGLPENTEAALTYVGIWFSGLIFILLEKDNKKIRFHAMQSLVTFGGLHLVLIVIKTLVGPLFFLSWAFLSLIPLLWLLGFILWLVLIVKAYQGEMFKLPIVGDFAAKQVK